MVDSMKQSFLLKPEVLTPNRNGFMAKKRKWHLKAESTVYIYYIYIYSILHILTIVFHGTRTVEYQPIFHGVT